MSKSRSGRKRRKGPSTTVPAASGQLLRATQLELDQMQQRLTILRSRESLLAMFERMDQPVPLSGSIGRSIGETPTITDEGLVVRQDKLEVAGGQINAQGLPQEDATEVRTTGWSRARSRLLTPDRKRMDRRQWVLDLPDAIRNPKDFFSDELRQRVRNPSAPRSDRILRRRGLSDRGIDPSASCQEVGRRMIWLVHSRASETAPRTASVTTSQRPGLRPSDRSRATIRSRSADCFVITPPVSTRS